MGARRVLEDERLSGKECEEQEQHDDHGDDDVLQHGDDGDLRYEDDDAELLLYL